MWAGVAGAILTGGKSFEIAISVHDSVYSTDFTSAVVPYNSATPAKNAAAIETYLLDTFKKFSQEHLCKFLGAGITLSLLKEVPPVLISSFLHRTLIISISPLTFALGCGSSWTLFPSSSISSLSTPILLLAPTSSTVSLPPPVHMFTLEQRPPLSMSTLPLS